MTAPADSRARAPRAILRRALRNSGLVLGGKAGAGVMQLATFALAARSLGATDFGYFAIVIAQVMLIAGLASFDSNQAIIRYGVGHLHAGDTARFQALLKTGTLLDFGAAAAATVATLAIAPLVGRQLGWSADLVAVAQLAAPLAFGNAISTTKGMMRLFERYDLLAAQALVTPASRLLLFAAFALAGSGLRAHVVGWVAAGWIGAAASLALAWREAHRKRMLDRLGPSVAGLAAANPGVWRFSILSNLNQTVGLVPTQLSVLIVAAWLGPAAAGVFRIAREVGTGMLKPIDLVNQALLADITRLVAARDGGRLWRTVARAGLGAAAAGLAVTLLIQLAGAQIVAAVFGPAFAPAAPILLAIAFATSLRVLAFSADPILFALGRPDASLAVSIATAAVFIAILAWRLPVDGLAAAGAAYLLTGLLGAVLSGMLAWRLAISAWRETDANLVP